IDTAEKGALIMIICLSAVAILVTFNTIRLAIYSSREEIEIMRLVGASNSFIRNPYIVEGIIYGIIGAIISLILIAPVTYFLSPYIKIFIQEMNLWPYFTGNIFSIFGYQLLFGVVLGSISSFIAVRKYLRI
ncbi:MAG: FtsX-like permease family protein, partial [Candidatus Wolfebacteria bacterium]|nr:FtsX-like permease family protein [Candidatus Wolfebacteria bacterium]